MMRRAGTFFERWLGGANFEFAIDGDRIAVNDFAIEAFGDGERKRRLTAARRAGDHDQ